MKNPDIKDTVYKAPKKRIKEFSFNKEVATVFDDMAKRSIPFYREVHNITASLCLDFYQEDTCIIDLGSSTGQLVNSFVRAFGKKKFIYFGIDNARSMVNKAKKNFAPLVKKKLVNFFKKGLEEFPFQNQTKIPPSVIVANFTIQFLSPPKRLLVLKKIYQELLPNGIFIMSEKIKEDKKRINDIFTKNYYLFKKKQGYTKMEISQKREALENVLIPFSTRENENMLKKAGFSRVYIIFKWFNFATFLAVK